MKPQKIKSVEQRARLALAGKTRTIQIGMSQHTAGVTPSTPVQVIDGADAPKLVGLPYLKTNFKNGNFSRTLYTPSTLKIVVGKDWQGE